MNRWKLELINRLIPANINTIRAMKPIHGDDGLDISRWDAINEMRYYLAKDTGSNTSLFTRIGQAITAGDYDTASKLQMEMNEKMLDLEAKYAEYTRNVL